MFSGFNPESAITFFERRLPAGMAAALLIHVVAIGYAAKASEGGEKAVVAEIADAGEIEELQQEEPEPEEPEEEEPEPEPEEEEPEEEEPQEEEPEGEGEEEQVIEKP